MKSTEPTNIFKSGVKETGQSAQDNVINVIVFVFTNIGKSRVNLSL